MAAMTNPIGYTAVTCPVCDTTIDIPVNAEIADTTIDGEYISSVVCTPDMSDVWAHAWTHEADGNYTHD